MHGRADERPRPSGVRAPAQADTEKLVSGARDGSIRVWSMRDGAHRYCITCAPAAAPNPPPAPAISLALRAAEAVLALARRRRRRREKLSRLRTAAAPAPPPLHGPQGPHGVSRRASVRGREAHRERDEQRRGPARLQPGERAAAEGGRGVRAAARRAACGWGVVLLGWHGGGQQGAEWRRGAGVVEGSVLRGAKAVMRVRRGWAAPEGRRSSGAAG